MKLLVDGIKMGKLRIRSTIHMITMGKFKEDSDIDIPWAHLLVHKKRGWMKQHVNALDQVVTMKATENQIISSIISKGKTLHC